MKPAFQRDDIMITSSKINQLYSEMYEPKLLPQDLLENLQLDNYISVDFFKKNEYTQAVTKCYLSNGSIAEYLYTFLDLKLLRLEEVNTDNGSIILYDRQTEIANLKKELLAETSLSIVS